MDDKAERGARNCFGRGRTQSNEGGPPYPPHMTFFGGQGVFLRGWGTFLKVTLLTRAAENVGLF
jgi:hypothetical protein